MRILFLSRWFPYPADNGSKLRVHNLIRQLAHQHEVTLVSFTEADVTAAARAVMAQLCAAVHTVPYRPFQPNRLTAVAGLLSPRPRSVVDTYSAAMVRQVQDTAARVKPDLVIASEIDMAPYALLVLGAPRILDELQLSVLREAAFHARSRVAWLRRTLTWWKHARYVRDLLRHFDGCTVVSDRERQLVKQLAPDSLLVRCVPNGVDLAHLSGDFGTPLPDTLIYTGALTYSANLDAMRYFVGDILPLVLAAKPGVRLAITGATTGVPADRLPIHPQVDLTGYLPDIRPAVAQSYLAIAPLRIGGGTRLKILESLALGTPVVTTSTGAEGLGLVAGQGILIADTEATFAEAVLAVLADPALRSRLREAGKLAVAGSDWSQCVAALQQLIPAAESSTRSLRVTDVH